MGAQNYLLAQKQTLAVACVVAGALLFLFSVYTVTNAETTHNLEETTVEPTELIDTGSNTHITVDEVVETQNSATDAEDEEDLNEDNTTNGVIKPISPIKPMEPARVGSAPSSNHSDTDEDSGINGGTEQSSTQAENDSNVRIRVRDRSRSEVNGDEVESGNHSLSIKIREETSTQ